VCALNPQLSPETERVLDRALLLDIKQRYQEAVTMKQDIDEILQHAFQVSGERSIYLRGSSGTLAASRSGTVPPLPVRPQRPLRPDPFSPSSPYAEGLRPLPGPESAPPRRPIYMDDWHDRPSAGFYQQQEMQSRRQQQRFLSPMPDQFQSENSRFIAMSFFFLLIVVALIAGFLIFLPWLQGF
jgi:hypothetical protein